jgi:23S rRNA (adenine2503-C2)-methyltransferase
MTVAKLHSVLIVMIISRMVFSFTPRLQNRLASNSRTFSSKSRLASRMFSTKLEVSSNANAKVKVNSQLVTLSTVTLPDLETLVQAWGYPKFRAKQVWNWKEKTLDIDEMTNLPLKLRVDLKTYTRPYALDCVHEAISKDGTIKRAYQLDDGQLIESVLMPYEKKGRYTACISSQAGCAQGCVFCATGQMGYARQLTADEIVEQVGRYVHLAKNQDGRLSNIVFMGMGEPLANYRNVKTAIDRIMDEYGIGARKITVSTVGIVPNIRKLAIDLPQVRLAVSLHVANDQGRTELLPANKRNGGLTELMTTLREYIETTGHRITLEWALIEGTNDDIDTANELVSLIKRHDLRRDMVHVNVIPLNPTGGYSGGPSQRQSVNKFCAQVEQGGIACTPRMRRGIDIDAGCGQLKAAVLKLKDSPVIGVYEDDNEHEEEDNDEEVVVKELVSLSEIEEEEDNDEEVVVKELVSLSEIEFDFDSDDLPGDDLTVEVSETARLLALVEGSVLNLSELDNPQSSKP